MLAAACRKPVQQPQARPTANAEPQVRATVVTVQTTLQPAKKTLTHQIVIAGERVRSMDDIDRWRLIDLRQNTVTFVDDITRSYRTESLAALVNKRRQAMAEEAPRGVRPAEFISTGAQRVMQNVPTSQSVIRAGGYQRQLWMANHPALPANLFSVLYASEPIRSRYAPVLKNVDAALINLRGFPFVDHAELPYGKAKLVIDRTVTSIEQRDIPAKWLNVNPRYTEVKEPAAGRPPASSPRPNQKTPAAESRSSATAQRTP